jgi:hypothetical protein
MGKVLFNMNWPTAYLVMAAPFTVRGECGQPMNASDITVDLLDANGNKLASATSVVINSDAGTWEAYFPTAPQTDSGTLRASCSMASGSHEVDVAVNNSMISFKTDPTGQTYKSWSDFAASLSTIAGLQNCSIQVSLMEAGYACDTQDNPDFPLPNGGDVQLGSSNFPNAPTTGNGFVLQLTIQSTTGSWTAYSSSGFFSVSGS